MKRILLSIFAFVVSVSLTFAQQAIFERHEIVSPKFNADGEFRLISSLDQLKNYSRKMVSGRIPVMCLLLSCTVTVFMWMALKRLIPAI